MIKKNILQTFLCLLSLPCFGQYVVKGGSGNPLLAKDDKENFIQVYLLNGLSGAEITYTSPNTTIHQWYKYKEKASEKIPVPCQQTGNTSIITDVEDGFGYFVENSADISNHYIWIIDYSQHVPVFNSITIEKSDDECERIQLLFDIKADKLTYYTPTYGFISEVVREYSLNYLTMVWNEGNLKFMEEAVDKQISGTIPEYIVDPAPLQNTDFVLSGDQFAAYFGMGKKMGTPIYEAIAVQAEVITDSIAQRPNNEMVGTDGSISAPATFTFTAYANEPVATFYTWKVFNLNKSATEPVSRTTSKILHYTFEDAGNYRVNLEVSDYQSICTYNYSLPDIIISDFMLWVPNAFSPTTSPGVNDIFKVAYKSVVKFNGWIFNRWGNELFHWTDPSQGWDGKYHGKYVPPGAYFYVIEAEDATGKKHVKKGDVNIVGGR